jgi:homoserine/homoserine lactone efflux protein
MSFQTWLAFTAASIILTLIPGPSVLLIVSQAITKGRTAALMCIFGDAIGGIVLIGLSFAGVGALLAASAAAFQIMKWAGVLYLAYLGCRQILEARGSTGMPPDDMTGAQASTWKSFWAGTITAILNPKAIVFYMAFLTQFIDPEHGMQAQITIMAVTSTVVVVVFLGIYALLASRARDLLKSRLAARRVSYTSGACLLGGSVYMAAAR